MSEQREMSHSQITVTTSATELKSFGTIDFLRIENNGSGQITLDFDDGATDGQGIVLAAGDAWEPEVVPINAIWAIAATGSPNVAVITG